MDDGDDETATAPAYADYVAAAVDSLMDYVYDDDQIASLVVLEAHFCHLDVAEYGEEDGAQTPQDMVASAVHSVSDYAADSLLGF